MNVNQTMHQANLSKWTALFHEQRQSGLTIKDWCTQNGVSVYAFFYWKRIAKETYIQSILPGAVPAQSGQFPSLSGNTAGASEEHELYNLSNPHTPQVNPAPAAITLSLDDVRISFDADASDDRIFRILKAVRHA